MTNEFSRPSKALIAYCILAERLRQPGTSLFQALTPFLAAACTKFCGELFDAGKFSSAVSQLYGIRMPKLTALGLTEQLAKEGLLEIAGGSRTMPVYRYLAKIPDTFSVGLNPLTENQVDSVISKFVDYVNQGENFVSVPRDQIEEAFFSRLLNIDSMRIFGRKEGTSNIKRTANTLGLKDPSTQDVESRKELHLDFLVSQFLLDLELNDTNSFELVSNVAFANMAAEAITCFTEPPNKAESLKSLTVYIDSPLVLDMIGVNVEYTDYGKELLDLLRECEVEIAIMDHCVAEAEAVIAAQLAHLRSGINILTRDWGVSTRPDLLSALSGKVADYVSETLKISIVRDPEINLHKRFEQALGSIQTEMNTRMAAWKNTEAKNYDQKSILSIISLRDSTLPAKRMCEVGCVLLTKNSPLVSIASDVWQMWLKDTTKHSRAISSAWIPPSVSDKQFAGYLWMRSGGSNSQIPRARLIAHCAAAIRPRSDVKAKVYNLMVETHGKQEADIFAALVVDREGERALMRATEGDPEDATLERLPFILHQVKLAAGDFAAAEERLIAEKKITVLTDDHKKELSDAEAATSVAKESAAEIARHLEQVKLDAEQVELRNAGELKALKKQIEDSKNIEDKRVISILDIAFRAGCREYKAAKWLFVLLFGLAAWFATKLSSIDYPSLSIIGTILLAMLGFWFVPELFDKPSIFLANRRLRKVLMEKDPKIVLPVDIPNFSNGKWSPLN